MVEMTGIWIHGHNMEVEYPDRLENFRRAASGTMVDGKAGTANWFHFAITTSEVLDNDSYAAGAIFVRFKSGSQDAYIKDVHIYDGEFKIFEFNDLKLHPDKFTTERFDPPLIELNYGLGISIRVEFGDSGASRRMDFSSAGAVFTSIDPKPVDKKMPAVRSKGVKKSRIRRR